MASGTAPGTVTYAFDNSQIAQMLPPGTYYGAIAVTAGGASNSPQSYEVVINVTPATTPSVPKLITGRSDLPDAGEPPTLPAPDDRGVFVLTSASTAFRASASTNSECATGCR